MARRYKALLAAQPMLSLLGLLLAWKLFPPVLGWLQVLALKVLYPGMGYGSISQHLTRAGGPLAGRRGWRARPAAGRRRELP